MAIAKDNPGRTLPVRDRSDHLTVYKKVLRPLEPLRGFGVIKTAGYSPCPIDRRCRARPWSSRSRPAFFMGKPRELRGSAPPTAPPLCRADSTAALVVAFAKE